jgi:hypothetical protein
LGSLDRTQRPKLITVLPGDGDRVELEAAPLRVFAAGVECAQQGAAGEVAGDGEVVAGREDGGGDRRLPRNLA